YVPWAPRFSLCLADVGLPAGALVGVEDAALMQLFAGLNPERILGAAMAVGMGRYALGAGARYATERTVWKDPIGAHQGVAHPLAQAKIEVELAKAMTQKAAAHYDAGDHMGAAEAANMAKYAAAEASIFALDRAIQTHGGGGLSAEYGLASMLAVARSARIAPVSREMILNFVAMHSLGLPQSYCPRRRGERRRNDDRFSEPGLRGCGALRGGRAGGHPDPGHPAQPQRDLPRTADRSARRAGRGRPRRGGACGGAHPHRRHLLRRGGPVRGRRIRGVGRPGGTGGRPHRGHGRTAAGAGRPPEADRGARRRARARRWHGTGGGLRPGGGRSSVELRADRGAPGAHRGDRLADGAAAPDLPGGRPLPPDRGALR